MHILSLPCKFSSPMLKGHLNVSNSRQLKPNILASRHTYANGGPRWKPGTITGATKSEWRGMSCARAIIMRRSGNPRWSPLTFAVTTPCYGKCAARGELGRDVNIITGKECAVEEPRSWVRSVGSISHREHVSGIVRRRGLNHPKTIGHRCEYVDWNGNLPGYGTRARPD